VDTIVYLNGSLLPLSQARLSPADYGLLYGYGVFETMRAYSGHVFRAERHINRLCRSAGFLGIALPDIQELKQALSDVLRANELSNARIRLTVSGGQGIKVPDLLTSNLPTVLITAQPYRPFPHQRYEQGFSAVVSRIRRNSQSPATSMKSLSYLDSLLARREARLAGVDEAIMLNEQGYVAEASTSNVFLVSGNVLVTPSEESGILPGITREVVLELAASLGLEAATRAVTISELTEADEAFLTNSLIELMPLTRLDGKKIGTGTEGQATQQLLKAYKALVDESPTQ